LHSHIDRWNCSLSLPVSIYTSLRSVLGKVASNLPKAWVDWGWDLWRQTWKVCNSTISTDIVLICTELATLSGDTLEVLLGRCIGITDLKKKTLLAERLTMELANDFLTDVPSLESEPHVLG
jgi:hypothetical protein